jgi:hypothetical protein
VRKPTPIRPADDTLNQARARNRRPAKWHDFTALIAGERKRAIPAYCLRADGQALFYKGKENVLFGETECGKDMLLCLTVKQLLEASGTVDWIDFEEGDELEIGNRLIEMGLDPELLCDRDVFRYATPGDVEAARNALAESVKEIPDIVILDGVEAARGVYGWDSDQNTVATTFRAQLVKPLLDAGIGVIKTDHITMQMAKDGKNVRYPLNAVMKLNMVNGAAYFLKAKSAIARGGEGASELIVTKDRPSSVKPACGRMKEPGMMYAGMLTVKSSESVGKGWDLLVEIIPPQPEIADEESDAIDLGIPSEVMERVSRLFEEAGEDGESRKAVITAAKGKSARKVPLAIGKLLRDGYLEEITAVNLPGGTHPIRSARPWRAGTDDKLRIPRSEDGKGMGGKLRKHNSENGDGVTTE